MKRLILIVIVIGLVGCKDDTATEQTTVMEQQQSTTTTTTPVTLSDFNWGDNWNGGNWQ